MAAITHHNMDSQLC